MITTTNLGSAPNQSWHTTINGHVYYFELRTMRGCLYASITIDNSIQINNVRCVNDGWLLPSEYISPDGGNFRFESSGGDYPSVSNFNTTCNIMHYDKDDISSNE